MENSVAHLTRRKPKKPKKKWKKPLIITFSILIVLGDLGLSIKRNLSGWVLICSPQVR